jgi:hypothetical protein
MNIKVLILLVAAVVVGFSSCKKENGDAAPVVPLQTSIDLINAGTDTINFYQNGTRQNNTASFYPNGTLGYFAVTAGSNNYQIKKAGTTKVLADMPLTLDATKIYSLFVAGQSADKVFLTKDSLITPDTTINATLRFVNASPGLVLDFKGTGFSYTNRAFKSATNFFSILGGTIAITIYQTGNATPLASGTIKLSGNTAYTLYTKGIPGGTGNSAFDVRLIINR